MRSLVIFILLHALPTCTFLNAQTTVYTEVALSSFAGNVCACLEEAFEENQDLQAFLYTGYNNCALQYLAEHPKSVEDWLIRHYDGNVPTDADSQQLVVEEAGVVLLRQGNPVLIRTCDRYREQLQLFKHAFFKQLVGEDPSIATIDQAIAELEAALPEIPQEENLVVAYNLLGVLNEFKEAEEQARLYYQRSVDIGKGQSHLAAMFLSAME